MAAHKSKRQSGLLLDGLSICLSLACLVHCLALPLLIAALPALADWLGTGAWTHLAVLAIALPASGIALADGWRRHRAFVPLAFGAIGLWLMVAGVALTSRAATETALTVAGSLLVAGAHLANWRNRRRAITIA